MSRRRYALTLAALIASALALGAIIVADGSGELILLLGAVTVGLALAVADATLTRRAGPDHRLRRALRGLRLAR